MPYKIYVSQNQKDPRPFKIRNTETGETVGSSETEADAEASIRARLAGKHGWKPSKRG